MRSLILADIPNPLAPIGDAAGGLVGGAASKAAEATWELFMGRLAQAVANAAQKVATEVLHFLDKSSSVSLDEGWWAGPAAKEVMASVLGFAAVLMVGFLFLALLQGLAAGEPTVMLRSVLAEAPMSVFGIVVLGAVTKGLLAITDGASAMVLRHAPDSLFAFFQGFGSAATVLSLGLAGIVMFVAFILGAFLVWVELAVRSSLIYLLLAFSPLVLAARVWPQLRGGWHAMCRLGVAVILSKFAIALALGLGAAALGGGGPKSGDLGTKAGLDLGGVLVGASLMLLAAFSPFIVLRVLPVFEAALVAHGIAGTPLRAGQSALQGAYYTQGLRRLAGGSPGGSGAQAAQGDGASPAGGGGGGPGPGAGGLAGGPRPAGGPAGAPASSSAAGRGAAASGAGPGAAGAGAAGAGAAGAGAAAPAAAAVMVPLGVGAKGAQRARQVAEGLGDVAGTSGGEPT